MGTSKIFSGPTLAQKITRQGPKSLKMTPKSKISKIQKNKKIIQKESYPSIRAKPQKLFRPHLYPKNNPIEHKKAENETKKKQKKKSKVGKQKKTRNESYQLY